MVKRVERMKRLSSHAIAKIRNNVAKARENLTIEKMTNWVDDRIGFTKTMLRPAPSYTMNPLHWLGALAIMTFGLQVMTGFLMLLYYVPTPQQAYATTMFIMRNVPFGHVLETIHVYGAYAMILLAFLHMMHGYFSSAHKQPRELMWVVGMLMGFTTLGSGLTGYLLPWTVLSKSATDVSIGMINLMPPNIGNIVKYLATGTGSDAEELTRFFVLHILMIPTVLLVLFAGKMYMFEIHGASQPASQSTREVKFYPWFPRVFLYITMIGSAYLSLLIAASIVFPLNLPPEYSVSAAQHYTAQPEWYFMAVYQVLKFAMFEGNNEPAAMALVTMAAILMALLPFIDRSERRDPAQRPLYSTIGLIIIVELIVLTVWGYLTPGQTIENPQALLGIGIPALATAVTVWLVWRRRKGGAERRGVSEPTISGALRVMTTPFKAPLLTVVFILLLLVGSLSFASFVNSLIAIENQTALLIVSIIILLASFTAMSLIVKSLVRNNQALRRT
jgi:cytochrome b6